MTSREAKQRGYEQSVILELKLKEEGREQAIELTREVEKVFTNIPIPSITLSVARGFDDEWSLTVTHLFHIVHFYHFGIVEKSIDFHDTADFCSHQRRSGI